MRARHNQPVQIENRFSVAAPPPRVFAYLLDVNAVAGCVPGAQLSEIVDPTTFKGKVKIKVGPIGVAYNGTARITSRDDDAHTATLAAEGREIGGQGSAKATVTMSVSPAAGASEVTFVTDFTVAGRVAQFGRGIMEDVSRRLVGQMAECIQKHLEGGGDQPADGAVPEPTDTGEAADPAASTPAAEVPATPVAAPAPPAPAPPRPAPAPAAAAEIDAVSLAAAMARDRVKSNPVPVAAGLAGLLALAVLLLRRRLKR